MVTLVKSAALILVAISGSHHVSGVPVTRTITRTVHRQHVPAAPTPGLPSPVPPANIPPAVAPVAHPPVVLPAVPPAVPPVVQPVSHPLGLPPANAPPTVPKATPPVAPLPPSRPHPAVPTATLLYKTKAPVPTHAAPRPPPPPPSNTNAGATTFGIDCSKFTAAVVKGGQAIGTPYPAPSQAQCNAFLKGFKAGNIGSAREAAMFLANIVWESDGLRAKEEYLCKQTPGACTSAYGAGNGRGSYFWGRGYIQLSWADNYRAASQALFGNDQLVQNPQQVSSNEDVAWGVSYWYWNSRVRNSPGVLAGNFGASINAINGPLECRGGHSDKAKKRFVIYTAILKIFAPSEAPKETGCYN